MTQETTQAKAPASPGATAQWKAPAGLRAAVARVQRAVVVPKAQYNSYAKFSFRSYEDIVAALKEPCAKEGIAFYVTDELAQIGDRYYVKATAHIFPDDGGDGELLVSAFAREDEHKKGSDDAQVTGMASTYARKCALCGAFAIEGQSDPDSVERGPAPEKREPPQAGPFTAHCRSCGARYQFDSMPQYMDFVANSPCCPRPDWQVE